MKKCIGIIAVVGIAAIPTASFADGAFVFDGPGYQPPVHATAAVPSARAQASVDEEAAFGLQHWMRSVAIRACMLSPSSTAFEPCFNQ